MEVSRRRPLNVLLVSLNQQGKTASAVPFGTDLSPLFA